MLVLVVGGSLVGGRGRVSALVALWPSCRSYGILMAIPSNEADVSTLAVGPKGPWRLSFAVGDKALAEAVEVSARATVGHLMRP